MSRESRRERFERLPPYARFLFYAVASGGLSYLLGTQPTVAWAVVSGVLFAAVMTAFDAWRLRRRDGG